MRLIPKTYCEHKYCARLATGYECNTGRYFCAVHETAIGARADQEQVSNQTYQRLAVAALVGQMESIISSGVLSAPAEASSRFLVAQTLVAFGMPSKVDLERESA